MSATTTAELRSFSDGYARTLHFFVSIARRSLYDQLDKLFQTRPELWPKATWLFDVQDVFVAYYEDASDMNSLWEEWTQDYERRLALLEGLPFAEQELALHKLSTLCMRTPQTINDILRLKARAHYAIKIITRTLLPTLTTSICNSILSQRKRLHDNRVKVKPVSLPPITQGVLELDRRGRHFILNLFPDEITTVEKLNLDMTKTIFELGQRAKAAIAARAQIYGSAGLIPGAKREQGTHTRIPASEFRADDERISRAGPPRSRTVHRPSTSPKSTPHQPPVMAVPASSQMVPPRPETAPIPPIPMPMHSTSQTTVKRRSGHPQPTASQPMDNGRRSTSSSAWPSTLGGVTAQAPRRPSSAASVHMQASSTLPFHTKASGSAADPVRAPHRKVFEVVNEDDELSKPSNSTNTYAAWPSPHNSQVSFVHQLNPSSSTSYTDHIPPVSGWRSPPVETSRDSVVTRGLENPNSLVPGGDPRSYSRSRPEGPSYDETLAHVSRARNASVQRNATEAVTRAPNFVHQSAPDDDKLDAEAMIQSLRQARLDPLDCLSHHPTLVIWNKENKICFIHRTGTDTTIIRVLAIRIIRFHAIDVPYFDIEWFLNPPLLRQLLQDSVQDNAREEQYQAGLLGRDRVERFQLFDGTGVLNGEYFVQQSYGTVSPESYCYNVGMTVTRDRLKEYVAGFELTQSPTMYDLH
ncbi:hypothetical protein BDZ89DRAFT_1140716 [Hymenopellis radicata]|nr:hypothetical protein BDZ89DRAFT_1140716 [Hymenopellis radicata]